MSGKKPESSLSDVAGTAKKCQVTMMETKVNIIERVLRAKRAGRCKTVPYNSLFSQWQDSQK